MRKGIWPIVFSVTFLASCQSSRFMRDDMYFTSYDAIREVRQFEVAQKEKESANKKEKDLEKPEISLDKEFLDNYYDYSYTARLRRFNQPDNSWAYYDPYFTNYYWFNHSNSRYFGQSVYSTYSWWGNNFGNNYNSSYWNDQTTGSRVKWTNPWSNNSNNTGWLNPYNRISINGWNRPGASEVSWNNSFSFTNMYYNSKDNNCYWWWWKDGNISRESRKGNFVALMQKNGISNDVIKRPDINYTQIKADYETSLVKEDLKDTTQIINTVGNTGDNSSIASKNSNTRNTTNNKNTNTTTNTSNTSKRWDNYKADVNISPNNKDANSNWSRSGVFSEGSRNNNYEFKGTIIQKKKPNDTQTQDKDPKN